MVWVDIEEFPHLKAWEDRMAQRPATEKGRHVPSRHTIKDLLKDKAAMEKHAADTRKWVQEGMKEDSKNKI